MAVADCSWYEYHLAPRPGERLVEVERMRALDQDCVPLLCENLEDPRLRVRTIAAWNLAEVGDERAIGPLCDALDAADRGLSPWARFLANSVGLFCMLVATLVAVFVALFMTHIWHCTDRGESFQEEWRANLAALRGHEVFVSALISALDCIIARHPVPEARRALSPLHRLAADTLRHQSNTRETAARTAHHINLATLNCHRLPLASHAPTPSPEALPLPAAGPDPDASQLSQVAGA